MNLCSAPRRSPRRLLAFAAALLAALPLCAQNPAPAPTIPDAPQPVQTKPLTPRAPLTPAEQAEQLRISKLALINGVPYDQPSTKDTLIDYVKDTYGWSGLIRTSIRAVYAQARNAPSYWNFGERFGSSAGVTVISGNVRLGMELLFHEDLRYIPCHGCRKRDKVANALLAEVTARHDESGRRFFTLTPTIADFSGPIIAHATWYNNFDPLAGVIATRTVFATRIGQHLFQEFVLERRHHDRHIESPRQQLPPEPTAAPPTPLN